ncbi:MAG TPA: DUF6755 family protein [Kofleriaceae bacterium]|nr:DUF6755 family protein [Kofleriaceae bacterium]
MPIRGPHHDLRPGARANATARLVVVALTCCLQYWLLTSTMEAFHGGDRDLPLPAALASVACLALGVALVAIAERGEARRRRARQEPGDDHEP